MQYLVAILDKDKKELIQLSFVRLDDALKFAKAGMTGYRVCFAVVYHNLKRAFGYHYDEDGNIESLIF